MHKSLYLLFLIGIFLASCSTPSFHEEDISLVPAPVHFILNEKSFRITKNTNIQVQDKSQTKAVNYLKGLFSTAAGFDLLVSGESSADGIVFEAMAGLKKEAYVLEVTHKRIRIKAADERGFFNAVQTIRQLLPVEIESKTKTTTDWLVPCVHIEDEPRFSWRGMHMDFSRHFFNIDEVKAFLDYMALYKMNTYHMHLTDDQGWRIEIKKYPLLTEKGAWRIENNQDTICNERAVENELYKIDPRNYKEIDGQRLYGGFFTQEQIKEIVAYADDRCITVLPEIDMPGHFKSAIDNYPYLSCTGESGWETVFTFPSCLGKETTYEFMENVLAEVVELFPGKYIHIGGDEVNIKSWEECDNCQHEIKKQGLNDEHELQSHFNRRIEKFLQSKGKQLMGWDEIVKGGLSEDASVMWWRNWVPEAPKTAAKNGNKVVITPTAAYYYDYLNDHNSMEKVYNYEPIPEDFTEEEAANVLGVQANLWSEWIPSFKRLQYQAFPRMLSLAETCWTKKDAKNFDDFFSRMNGQYLRMDAMGIYYYFPAVQGLDKEIVFVDSTLVKLNLVYEQAGVEIYYTLDGSVPTRESLKYTAPFMVNKVGKIKARAYLGDRFNDIKMAKVVQTHYREMLDVESEKGALNLWETNRDYNNVKEIQMPALAKLEPVTSIELGDVASGKTFSRVYKGFFFAKEDGVYEFELKSDGESLFYFGEDLIIDKGKEKWNPFRKAAKVALKKGWHAFSVYYLSSTRPKAIELRYAKQGEPLVLINDLVVKM